MAADLKAKLNLDTSGFDDGIKNAKSKTDEFKKTAEDTSKSTDKLSDSESKLAAKSAKVAMSHEKSKKAIKDFNSNIIGLTGNIGSLMGAMNTGSITGMVTALMGLQSSVSGITGGISGLGAALKSTLLSPVGIAVGAIGGLAAMFVGSAKASEEFEVSIRQLSALTGASAELENNPLFKQIFSRYGYSQETGVVRQPAQTAQQEIPQLPNNQQVVDSFRNLAELLLKDSNLTAKDMALLKNFVNSSQTQLSQQDAKQLNLLLKMVQSNVPAAIQQAGQQPGMEGLPKLWAFLQLADLGSLKDLKAKDFKNANKEIKTVVSSLKSSISSEGSYQADGQKSISFVMPLYIGEGGHSYPAYINLYDEPEHEDECGRKRKDTWFRVCVLTDNIGAVDIVCQLFEGNNLNLRINFSDNEIVKDFGEYLPDIRKALYNTSIHLNDLRVGTVN